MKEDTMNHDILHAMRPLNTCDDKFKEFKAHGRAMPEHEEPIKSPANPNPNSYGMQPVCRQLPQSSYLQPMELLRHIQYINSFSDVFLLAPQTELLQQWVDWDEQLFQPWLLCRLIQYTNQFTDQQREETYFEANRFAIVKENQTRAFPSFADMRNYVLPVLNTENIIMWTKWQERFLVPTIALARAKRIMDNGYNVDLSMRKPLMKDME